MVVIAWTYLLVLSREAFQEDALLEWARTSIGRENGSSFGSSALPKNLATFSAVRNFSLAAIPLIILKDGFIFLCVFRSFCFSFFFVRARGRFCVS